MKNQRIHQSSGITIIEVLFSIGIIVTGLLGVAGLIMIAGAQMTQGLEADAMSNAGLNAIAEFETRNMQRPDSMAWYNKSTKRFTSVLTSDLYGPGDDGFWGVAGVDDDENGTVDDISEAGHFRKGEDDEWGIKLVDDDGNGVIDDISEAGWPGSDDIPSDDKRESPSFCIDPYFIAQQAFDGNSDKCNNFPGGNPPRVSLKRVTLRNMSLPLSREIFIAKDDLAFSTPASGTELPEQQWIREGLNGRTLKRANQAAYSWLAMLTPNRSRENTVAAAALSTNLEPTDHYLLSIVVFKNRVVTNTNDEEQFFEIEFLNQGFGGGEVQLSPTNSDHLYPKHGDWVMLSTNSQIGLFHRWYRITYIEDETRPPDDTNPKHYRNATLQGPDWSRDEWHNGNSTQVTFIPGVIGVFEKTIRLGSARSY